MSSAKSRTTAVRQVAMVGSGTSREAEGTSRTLHRLPYSRSSFEEVAHAVGALYGAERVHVEAALVEALEVPQGSHSVSLSLDRVALPMEEPKARPMGRPRKEAPERPVDVVFRMAYAACLTFVEATCKSLIGVRMRRPGSRWKHESGQHVIDLRSLVLSDCWEAAMDLTLAPLRAQVRRAA